MAEWYNIECKKWCFLEAGEAKMSIDSHHAQVSHAIKRYVRLGFDLTAGEDIEKALDGLSGTSTAYLKPNQGSLAGYVCARDLPGFGEIKNFSMSKFTQTELIQPEPTRLIIDHFPKNNRNRILYLPLGWALKCNQKYGKKGSEKRLAKEVIAALTRFFMVGQRDPSDRYTTKDMLEELNEMAENSELIYEVIPSLKTIEN
ncbi:hypothetical protein C2G38_2176369 [Gigaspora rosea]|uniref:Uncharacterized protein n=1 Tax=Gigaspora rosea TaxID=44941 RepID=A0A397VGB4_9GLOM|nr:hypothetical protein C2G38_2176369 [Gigaspora rosea]